jgi:hypothetical protein
MLQEGEPIVVGHRQRGLGPWLLESCEPGEIVMCPGHGYCRVLDVPILPPSDDLEDGYYILGDPVFVLGSFFLGDFDFRPSELLCSGNSPSSRD